MNSESIPGGIVQGNLPDEIVNFIKQQLKQNYVILTITNVKTQVVSGSMYYFVIRIFDKSNCQVYKYNMSVWAQPWLAIPYKIQKMEPIVN